jgi:hypothetical protein
MHFRQMKRVIGIKWTVKSHHCKNLVKYPEIGEGGVGRAYAQSINDASAAEIQNSILTFFRS